jgi:hypothetical protein
MTPIPTLPGRSLARLGSAILALFATSISLPAQTFQTIHNFCAERTCPDGSTPNAGVVQAAAAAPVGSLTGNRA